MEEKRTTKEARPLDAVYQDAESIFAGKIAAIEQAAVNTRAKQTYAAVLRWYLEHGANQRPIIAQVRTIAASFWLKISERTVQRAHKHWKAHGVLTFTARVSEDGANLPPWASLDWDAVLRLACTVRSGAVLRPATRELVTRDRRSQDDCGGPFSCPPDAVPEGSGFGPPDAVPEGKDFLAGGDRPSVTGDGDMSPSPVTCHHPPGDMSPSPGDTPDMSKTVSCAPLIGMTSPREVLAGARAVVFCSYVCSSTTNELTEAREVTRAAVQALAAQAASAVWPHAPPRPAWPKLIALAAAAKLLFNEVWLLRTAEEIGSQWRTPGGGVRDPLKVLIGALRKNLARYADVEPILDTAASRDWFASVLAPFERGTRDWLPPPQKENPPPREETPEEIEALRADLRSHVKRGFRKPQEAPR